MNLYDVLLAKKLSGGGGSGLPAVTTDDNGKVMTVVEGAWDKADVPTELPAVTGADNGKFLGVANGAWGAVNAPSGNTPLYWHSVALTGGGRLTYATCIIINTTPDNITLDDIKNIVNADGKIVIVSGYGTDSSLNPITPIFITKSSSPDTIANIYYMESTGSIQSGNITWNALTIQSFGTDSHQIM